MCTPWTQASNSTNYALKSVCWRTYPSISPAFQSLPRSLGFTSMTVTSSTMLRIFSRRYSSWKCDVDEKETCKQRVQHRLWDQEVLMLAPRESFPADPATSTSKDCATIAGKNKSTKKAHIGRLDVPPHNHCLTLADPKVDGY